METKGRKMKVSFEWREGKNDDFAVVFSLMETTEILSIKKGTTMKIWTEERHEAFKSLQEPTLFSNKICSLKAQKALATFFYSKFYRWLTVAPLWDGAFLKASRTLDLHSLRG